MKLSRLIEILSSIKEKHGDCDVWKGTLFGFEEAEDPVYHEATREETNYSPGFIPECHPHYKGVFINGVDDIFDC